MKKSGLGPEIALLFLLAVLWGSSYLFIKVAVTQIPPITLIALRVSIAAAILMLILSWQGGKLPRDTKTWRMLFVQAMLNSVGAWTILAWGQQYIDSATAAVLNSTSPVFVFIMTALLTRHESTNLQKLLGVCLGLLGIVLIVGVDVLAGLGEQVAGQLAALFSAVLFGGAAIYGKRFSSLSATATAAGTMIWAMVCLVPLSLVLDAPWNLSVTWQAGTAALFLGVFCTGVAMLIYFRLIKTLGSMGVASQSFLRAGVGVILGATLLGEQITPIVALGVILAIAGVALINLPSSRRKSPSSGGT